MNNVQTISKPFVTISKSLVIAHAFIESGEEKQIISFSELNNYQIQLQQIAALMGITLLPDHGLKNDDSLLWLSISYQGERCVKRLVDTKSLGYYFPVTDERLLKVFSWHQENKALLEPVLNYAQPTFQRTRKPYTFQ